MLRRNCREKCGIGTSSPNYVQVHKTHAKECIRQSVIFEEKHLRSTLRIVRRDRSIRFGDDVPDDIVRLCYLIQLELIEQSLPTLRYSAVS